MGRSNPWSRLMVGCRVLISMASRTLRLNQPSSLANTSTLFLLRTCPCSRQWSPTAVGWVLWLVSAKPSKSRPYSQPSTETRDSTCPRSTAKFYLSVSHVIAVVRRAVTQPRRSGQLPVAARRRRRDVFESLRLQAKKDS